MVRSGNSKNLIKVFIIVYSTLLMCISAQANTSSSENLPLLPKLKSSSLDFKPHNNKNPGNKAKLTINNNKQRNYSKKTHPKLNFLQLNGYFRTRLNLFHRLDLGILDSKISTHKIPNSPLSPTNCTDDNTTCGSDITSSTNMRFRLDGTLNISEDMRIRSTVDIFDNYIFGSNSKSTLWSAKHFQALPDTKDPLVKVKNVWAEATFPFGELRFGKMPFNFGLGLLYNSGNHVNDDYISNFDGFMLTTTTLDHFMTFAYAVNDIATSTKATEHENDLLVKNQLHNLDGNDDQHCAFATISKLNMDSLGENIVNYGAAIQYSWQIFRLINGSTDSFTFYRPNKNIWTVSAFAKTHHKNFLLAAEGGVVLGEELDKDKKTISTTKGGISVESRYGMLRNKLGLGLNGGWASGNLSFASSTNQTTLGRSTFSFNPNYNIDLILFKEKIGSFLGASYIKPHLDYSFSDNLQVNGSLIISIANYAKDTPGRGNLLAAELDLGVNMQTDEGFFIMIRHGLLFPFAALDQGIDPKKSKTAKIANLFKCILGINF